MAQQPIAVANVPYSAASLAASKFCLKLLPADIATHVAINPEAAQRGRPWGQLPYALHWNAVCHLCMAC